MKYTIDMRNGQSHHANSMNTAMAIVRHNLGGAARLYRGAEYQTDRPAGDDREYVTALDIWTSKRDAQQQMNTMADAVISWV